MDATVTPVAHRPARVAPSYGGSDWLALRFVGPLLALLHLALVLATQPLRGDHLLAEAALAIVPWLGREGRRLLAAALPMVAGAALYDTHQQLSVWRGAIDFADLRAVDAAWFPVPSLLEGSHALRTWPEWFAAHHRPALDLLLGAAYTGYLIELCGIGLLLHFVAPERGRALAWAFLVSVTIGVAIHLLYPTVLASGAGSARFEQLLGLEPQRSLDVSGAMPSLHATFAVLAAIYARSLGPRWRHATTAFACLVCAAAIYVAHHYVIDVVAGLAVGLVAAGVVALATGRPRSAGSIQPLVREGT